MLRTYRLAFKSEKVKWLLAKICRETVFYRQFSALDANEANRSAFGFQAVYPGGQDCRIQFFFKGVSRVRLQHFSAESIE